jgi:hypothetical protein
VRLPDKPKAKVEIAKVRDYLLSGSHPIGRIKARFFAALGFSQDDPALLVEAVETLAAEGDVVDQVSTRYGTKHVVDGLLRGPRGHAPVRTVWIVDAEGGGPRLVTAYPAPEEGGAR